MSAPVIDLKGRSPWSVLPPLVLGFFMIMVDTTIVNIAIPSLVKSFDTSLTNVGWVNSAYLLSFAVLMLPSGRLGDRYGPRLVFITGLVVFTLSSAMCGLAGSIGVLIAARVIQGIGAALMTPQTMAVITRVFPPKTRGAAMGIWGSVAGLATIAGPVIGGALVESWGWEWIFYVNVPVGVVALVWSVIRVPHLETHKRYFDILGVVLAVVGLFCIVFGLQEGDTYSWGQIAGPLSIWTLVGFGLVVLAGFVWWQHRLGERALLPLRLFHHRNFSLANVTGMAISFSMIGVFFPLTVFLQSILGLSPLHAALINLPASLLSGVIAPFAGRLSDKIPGKWVVAAGFAAVAASMLWLHGVITPGVSTTTLVIAMLPFGIGTGLVFSPMSNIATSGLDHKTAGAGAGAFNTTRQVGGVIGSAAIVAMLTSRLSTAIPDAARTASASLPAGLRQPFVNSFANAQFSADSLDGATKAPAGVPASAAGAFQSAAQSAVANGFVSAVRDTLILVAAVLVLGMVAALFMRGKDPVTHGAHGAHIAPRASAEPEATPEPEASSEPHVTVSVGKHVADSSADAAGDAEAEPASV